MSDQETTFRPLNFLAPKYWPTWIGLGLLWLSSRLPYRWMVLLGTWMGWLSYHLMPGRRRITRTNIRLVFPELNKSEQLRIIKGCFYSAGISLFESALTWWGSDEKLKSLYRIEGLENLHNAEQLGKGVILLGGHYTTLEISGRLLSYHVANLRPTYKRAHNPLFEAIMVNARKNHHDGLINSNNMRSILRNLKNKKVVWYAPDQDFGMMSAVFAPFMGVTTATLTFPSRLSRASKAPVLPYYSERLPGGKGYLLRLGPIIENFPTEDDVYDATLINQTIEKQVRRTPEQYLWIHRRFKTRPLGEPLLYPLRPPTALKMYRLALGLISFPAIIYTLHQAYKNKDSKYLRERLGAFKNSPATKKAGIWIHAASVGEVNAVLPLLKALQQRFPQWPVFLTTGTPTGGQIARTKLPNDVQQYYLPIDWQRAVGNFLEHTRPKVGLIMETEFWPNMHEVSFHHGVPLIIINGRLTQKTLQVPKWLHFVYHRMMAHIHAIIVRSEEDKKSFIKLRGNETNVYQIDNLKFSGSKEAGVDKIDLGRPYILAASTRDSEEKLVVEAWQNLSAPKPLLVIVPRHPKRLENILADLKPHNLNIAIRSQTNSVSNETDVYIADTFGELNNFMAGAELIFMGGSLVPCGGHNILEPAQLGNAIIFGPYMGNFKDEADLLLQASGAKQVSNSHELSRCLTELLEYPDQAQKLGENALQALNNKKDVIERYLETLSTLYPFCTEPASSYVAPILIEIS